MKISIIGFISAEYVDKKLIKITRIGELLDQITTNVSRRYTDGQL